jgi:hypothetical protein
LLFHPPANLNAGKIHYRILASGMIFTEKTKKKNTVGEYLIGVPQLTDRIHLVTVQNLNM